MKIAIIGPVSPYRGGISHSNMVLCSNLSKRNNVTSISFKRMFPEFLYPGRLQKDNKRKGLSNVRVLDILDSINPLNWMRVYALIKMEGFDLVGFQWWSPFFTPCYTAIAWLARKFSGAKISVICQNVTSHEDRSIDRLLTKTFFKSADFFITYSSADKQDVKRILPGARVEHIIEGTYERQIGNALVKEKAKSLLRMKGRNIMFFGFVRKYKGLLYLLRAMPHILEKYDVTLHIIGEFWEDKGAYLKEIKDLGIAKNVKIVDRYVSDSKAAEYFSAVDAVILPYTSSTESGIIQLAYGFNTPIITTDTGGNKDLIEHGKSGLLVKPMDSKGLAENIILFYSKNMEGKVKMEMKKKQGIFAWTREKENKFFGNF